jgi:protein arginine kinase activator
MLCELCGKEPSTVSYVEVVNQRATTHHLCAKCAEKRGIAQTFSQLFASVQSLWAKLLQDSGSSSGHSAGPSVTCPRCGLSFPEFQAQGKLGCGQCYKAFDKYLIPLLRRIHGNTTHIGKLAVSLDQDVTRKRELRRLREDMRRAVQREDFEAAAQLRDRIRGLEEKPI